MKYIIILAILLSGCSYSKRLDTLEKNQVEIVKGINCLADDACAAKLKEQKEKK